MGSRAVVIVARMSSAERYKGHDALLDAWPAVVARQKDAQLVVVGGGDDLPRLEAKARDLGVAGRVLFTGYVDEPGLAAIYGRAAALAMPSRGEGFGLAYLEAMAHGLPCVGSIHDAAGEVIQDGATGFLVDQADIQALADRVTLLLDDEARRRAMGEAGRRLVAERFTAERFAGRLLALIDGALGAGGVVPAGALGGSR
jgi:phosphatidylinositol alpha-1,6-mannosyltransferase